MEYYTALIDTHIKFWEKGSQAEVILGDWVGEGLTELLSECRRPPVMTRRTKQEMKGRLGRVYEVLA